MCRGAMCNVSLLGRRQAVEEVIVNCYGNFKRYRERNIFKQKVLWLLLALTANCLASTCASLAANCMSSHM